MARVGRMEKRFMRSERHTRLGVQRAEDLVQHLEMDLDMDLERRLDYLELGCGVGHVAKHFASKYGWNVTATDYDPEMIAHATQGFEGADNLRFMQMDATDIPLGDGTFDIVLSFGILHHIGHWQDAIAEVGRVLRGGGHYLLGELVYSRVSRRLLVPFARNYGVFTIDDLTSSLEASGMRVVHREPPKGSVLKHHGLVLQRS